MLHIFISVPASLPPNLPISPSISLAEVQCKQPNPTPAPKSILPMGIQPKMILIAMSNTNGFIPDHLLPQIYGTTVLDEDVDLSDEDLELIANGESPTGKTDCSDIIVNGDTIVTFESMRPYVDANRQDLLIEHIAKGLREAKLSFHHQLPGVLSNQVRHDAPRIIKGERRGFIFNLENACGCYANSPNCPSKIIGISTEQCQWEK